ncbi:unnamed protein product [Tetraodon nigroviridis]|uniref:(spotted green pufferfish) hypothetical protein n=1 Tax=Tetraodon nigroviridis TaxID=99883 RepID=Q4RPY3_TETNG|nr:unnamed protein product [Tetraodon nigroviridis]
MKDGIANNSTASISQARKAVDPPLPTITTTPSQKPQGLIQLFIPFFIYFFFLERWLQ